MFFVIIVAAILLAIASPWMIARSREILERNR